VAGLAVIAKVWLVLLGRAGTCARLDALVHAARAGTSVAVVLTGEPGVGKTTLIDHLAGTADGMRILRTCGVEAESSLSYAGLADLLAPVLALMSDLPEPQAAALSAALAIGPPAGGDRFAVHAAALSLLVAAASRQPLLIVVDDAHWLDESSMEVLSFVQRRLRRDPIAVVLAYRVGAGLNTPAPSLPVIELPGFTEPEGAALLQAHGLRVDEVTLAWLMRETGGNPLALLELPKLLSPSELAALPHRAEPAPIAPALERFYGRGVQRLPGRTRRALLIVSLLHSQDAATARAALGARQLTVEDLLPAVESGLLQVTPATIAYRHPLVRSAVHQVSAVSDKQDAHRAVAAALAASTRPDAELARAWHLAEATLGADDRVADLLTAAAGLTLSRGGCHAASLAFERAAHLSTAAQTRAARLLQAASAAYSAGQLPRASGLADLAESDAGQSADIAQLRARIDIWSGAPLTGARGLESEASRIRATDPLRAVGLLLEANVGAVFAGRVDYALQIASDALDIGRQLGGSALAVAKAVAGAVGALDGGGDDPEKLLGEARQVLDTPDPPAELLDALHYLASGYAFLDRFEVADPLFQRVIRISRERGGLSGLALALALHAFVKFRRGNWEAAYASAIESARLADDTGHRTSLPISTVALALVEAGRGMADARVHATAAIQAAREMGAQIDEAHAHGALGLLDLSLGNLADAIDQLTRCELIARRNNIRQIGHLQWAPELVEAHVRAGSAAAAGPVMRFVVEQAEVIKTPIARAFAARCQGLLADDGAYEDHFHTALHWHRQGSVRPFELARTQLCFGERLRRSKRRRDARVQLQEAWKTFTRLGAHPWAKRAAAELGATGVTVSSDTPHLLDLLTPQELQVAMAVADGASNRGVAGNLFLSQKTVEFHLSRIYRKLGLHSRTELTQLLQDRERA